ncbi:MAG TPA: HlyD family efflux transporter periplasmic adaptor subunit [Stellaceae bacterium]|nr:HlyD family efflux transporter periplasmic adaptor subunit [Stellaceae bacterium]
MNVFRSAAVVLVAAAVLMPMPPGSRAAPAPANDGVVVGRGRLEPLDGYRHVSASLTSGRPVVARLLVHKGSRVRAGEVTAELDQTETDRAAVAVDEAQLARSQAAIAQMKAGAKPAAIAEQQALVRQREADVKLADIERRRAELLRTRGAQSEAAFTFRTLDEANKQALLDQANSGLAAMSEPRPVDVAVAAGDVAVARAQLAQARAQLEETIVRAPEDGTVTEIFARAGERIGENGIYELADLDHLYAIAEIDEAFAAGVRLGQHANLFDRLGRPLGAGTVVRVGQRVFDASRPSEDVMLGKNSRFVEVAVKPDDPARLPRILGLELVVKISTARPKAGAGQS